MSTADPDVAPALASIQKSTSRLLATADALTDGQAHGPSLLPGWTRGHVLSHLARNADAFCHLFHWARTGTEMPMYASDAARDRDIAAGAGRSAADLAADVSASAAAFAGAAAALPAAAWSTPVRARYGPPFPARVILSRRRSELEFHHVDLAAGYQPADWPPDWVQASLTRVAGDFAGRDDTPSCLACPDGTDYVLRIGPPADDPVTVSGPPALLLAWLTGRAGGTGLEVAGAAAPPVLPPWR